VVDDTAADQARAVDEVEALPEGAVIVRMLGDYAVPRDHTRACRQHGKRKFGASPSSERCPVWGALQKSRFRHDTG